MNRLPLSRISRIRTSLKNNTTYSPPLSIYSEDGYPEDDAMLSCYGTMYDHIHFNLEYANNINPYYDKCKNIAFKINVREDTTSVGMTIKHLMINAITPLISNSITPIILRTVVGKFNI